MFSWIVGRLRCLRGKHERSQKLVKIGDGDKHTSKCMYCGVPMIRRAKRDWIIASKA